jgi:fumarate reductase (CoM/CoB) subunit A
MSDAVLTRGELQTDVLVVGGGLAALRAALDARRAGAQVTIAVKGKLGKSGSSAMTSAGYSSAFGDNDSPANHLHDTLVGGRSINSAELAEVMALEAPGRLDELIALGGELAMEDGKRLVHPSGDHSTPRTVVAANFKGLDFTLPLAEAVRECGCEVLEHTMVADVLLEGEIVRGAICVSAQGGGSLIGVRASSVLLATGGCGQLFRVTSNPNDVTGDGYAMALRAGALLRDLEFIQFYPWRCIVPFENTRMPIQPSTFVLGARLLNSDGERFMSAYDPQRHEATTRDVAARGIYDQIRLGKQIQGGVLLDVSGLSDEDWRRSNHKPNQYFERRGIDFREVEMIIAPEAHFFMGGVASDAHGRTSIPGLFVAGENAGGVHGANRLDSNAIPETQVFGARAGRAAAAHAQAAGSRPPIGAAVDAWHDAHATMLPSTEQNCANEVAELRRALQDTAWEKLGIVRDEERLLDGLKDVAAMREEVLKLPSPAAASETIARLEFENLLTVGRACFTAALHRRESRGAHYRLDFPCQDDAHWKHPVFVELDCADNLRLRDDSKEPLHALPGGSRG